MAKKKILNAKRIAIFSAVITLISFGYKFTLGILATSLVMLIAAFPTLFVFICKATFAKNLKQSREDKRKAYLIMTIVATAYSAVFILFSVLKVGGIDITNQNRFEGWIGIIFIFFIIVMFVLSIIKLKGALEKSDILVIGMKEITFISALADAMMIFEFLYRVLLKYMSLPFMGIISRYFPLGVGVGMVIVCVEMIKRYLGYKANMNK